MSRQELNSDMLPKTEQLPPADPSTYDGDIVMAERIESDDYAEALAFMAEPVTIVISPSTEKNAARSFPVWVNGKPAEVFMNGRWHEVGWLPVGQEITVRRSVLEIIIRAKVDTVDNMILDRESDRPNNKITRDTSPVHSFSVSEDRNPRGRAWMAEMRRRTL